ncbi:MAG: cysteine desulfurase family protein, partial [Thermoanaerobaculia bacterium]
MRGAYFDHNATTPLDPRVREAMLPWLGERWGNASSAHGFGRQAREAVEGARDRVAALLGARPADLVFCGSGTEANNAVLAAVAGQAGAHGRIVLSAFEHPSIDGMATLLGERGLAVTRVKPRPDGVVDAGQMAAALTEDTVLACLMLANNELGTVQPVAAFAEACRRRGVPLLCDAVQAAGKTPVAVEELGADYLVLGAHKFYGPLGAAALWLRPGAEFTPYLV